MLFTSCSFAYTIDDFLNFTQQVKDQNSSFNKSTTQILAQQESLKRDCANYNFTTFIVTNANWTQSFETTQIAFRLTSAQVNVQTNNVQISSGYQNSSQWYTGYYYGGSWHITQSPQNWSNFSSSTSYGLIELYNQTIDNWYNNWFNGRYIPPYTGPVFTPSNNGSIEVIASNGVTENMTRLPFSYNGQKDWTLGYLSEYSDVYSIYGYFGPLFYREGQLYTESYQNEFSYNYYYGTNNSGLLFDSSTGRVSIKRENLVNKQGYNLLLMYRLNSNDVIEDIGDYNYYAYFFNLNINSGDLVSPDINSTVDIGMLNALDDYLYYDSGDKDNTKRNINDLFGIGTIFSGDFFSGEIFQNLNYKDYYENDYSLFLYSIYDNVLDTLMDTNTNSSIVISYRDFNLTLFAEDFAIPNGPLKYFVTMILVTGIIMLLIHQFHSLIISINTLDVVGITHSFDRNYTFFM